MASLICLHFIIISTSLAGGRKHAIGAVCFASSECRRFAASTLLENRYLIGFHAQILRRWR